MNIMADEIEESHQGIGFEKKQGIGFSHTTLNGFTQSYQAQYQERQNRQVQSQPPSQHDRVHPTTTAPDEKSSGQFHQAIQAAQDVERKFQLSPAATANRHVPTWDRQGKKRRLHRALLKNLEYVVKRDDNSRTPSVTPSATFAVKPYERMNEMKTMAYETEDNHQGIGFSHTTLHGITQSYQAQYQERQDRQVQSQPPSQHDRVHTTTTAPDANSSIQFYQAIQAAQAVVRKFQLTPVATANRHVPTWDRQGEKRRLHRALLKNLEYVAKRDEEAVQLQIMELDDQTRLLEHRSSLLAAGETRSKGNNPTLTKLGIGSEKRKRQQQEMDEMIRGSKKKKISENSHSIYVSGFQVASKDENQLEKDVQHLFGFGGKLRRVKVYKNRDTGKLKGDALVVYESIVVPFEDICTQLNGAELPCGSVLMVQPAVFDSKPSPLPPPKASGTLKQNSCNDKVSNDSAVKRGNSESKEKISIYVSGFLVASKDENQLKKEVRHLFGFGGTLRSVKVYKNRDTGKLKGDALVVYESCVVPFEDICTQLNGAELPCGSVLVVQPAVFDYKPSPLPAHNASRTLKQSSCNDKVSSDSAVKKGNSESKDKNEEGNAEEDLDDFFASLT